MRINQIKIALFLSFYCLFVSVVCGDVRLPSIFGRYMVLQQESSVPIWGWAEAGEKIQVRGSWTIEANTIADKDGKWRVEIQTPKASEKAVTLTVEGNNKIVFEDILIGEVWICSGQSNMEYSLAKLGDEKNLQAIEQAHQPQIRLFKVARQKAHTPLEDCAGSWKVCSPETVKGFSAVGYYYGKRLRETLNVPIALISTNYGGTPAEAWTSAQTLSQYDKYKEYLKAIGNLPKGNEGALYIDLPEDRTPGWPRMKDLDHPYNPNLLYNGMIAPLIPFRIAGAIWYQGEAEANTRDPIFYRTLFPAMINDWRQQWGQGDFPFYYVQIAPWKYDERKSQALREAQMMTLSVANTGMAVTLDIGHKENIHPKNKVDVGDRLARWALAKTYGKKNIVYSGPLYKSMNIEGDSIRLEFDDVNGGLVAEDGQLRDFMISDGNKEFVSAKAVIDGDTIVVSSDQIKNPVAVRYAWSNWASGSLFSKAGLPASSFRTDDWSLE